MSRKLVFLLLAVLISLPILSSYGQATGVTAEAIGTANLRSIPSIDGDIVGEIASGTRYPVIGRSEFYPWLLLGDPATNAPFGWVFQDLVTVVGNITTVPFSTAEIGAGQPAPTATPAGNSAPPPTVGSGSGDPTATLSVGVTPLGDAPAVTPPPAGPTLTPTLDASVTGTSLGEINLRYGPSIEYQVIGRARAGDVFEITGYHTQFPWLQIRFDASPTGFAWVADTLLEVRGDIFSTRAISATQFDLPELTPTPAMRASSGVPGQETVTISPAFGALGDDIWEYLLAQNFVPESRTFGAFYLQDLTTGEAIAYNSDVAFSGTSINKIAVLLAYYSVLDGSPNLTEARDIANTMICSTNVPTNNLLGVAGRGDMLAGAEVTTDLLTQLGAERTFITVPYSTLNGVATATPMPRAPRLPETNADQISANPDPSNQVTVEEMGWVLSSIYQCAYDEAGPLLDNFDGAFTPQECRQMLYVMSQNTVDGMLKAGAPDGVRVAHKHGWIDETHTNAGVFFTPGGDYVMVMALHEPSWLNYERSLPVFGEAGRRAYNYFNPAQPLNAVREGLFPDDCDYTTADPLVNQLADPLFLLNGDPEVRPQTTPTMTPTPTSAP